MIASRTGRTLFRFFRLSLPRPKPRNITERVEDFSPDEFLVLRPFEHAFHHARVFVDGLFRERPIPPRRAVGEPVRREIDEGVLKRAERLRPELDHGHWAEKLSEDGEGAADVEERRTLSRVPLLREFPVPRDHLNDSQVRPIIDARPGDRVGEPYVRWRATG